MKILQQPMECMVLDGEAWGNLRYSYVVQGSLTMYMTGRDNGQKTYFEEGKDFAVDYENGRVRRLAGSTLPDGRDNVFYGMECFNHTLFEKYGNYDFTVYTSYAFDGEKNTTLEQFIANRMEADGTIRLTQTMEKLKAGKDIKYLVYGDSISTGAEASSLETAYFGIFAETLRKVNPQAQVDIVMKAIGGEDSNGGLQRLAQDVLEEKPDLVTIGYGMNDQNRGEEGRHFVEPEKYEENIECMIRQLTAAGVEVVLITPCLPHPCWAYTSGDAGLYAGALRRLGSKYGIPVADVQAAWVQELEYKKSHEAMLLNNINHPNDYGHSVYGKVLCGLI